MIKVVAMYRTPADPKDFDDKYFSTHVPLTNKLPGLKKVEIAKVFSSSKGDNEWYLVADLYFDCKEDMDKALSSPEAKEARANLKTFGGDVLLYALNTEIQKVPAPAGK